MLLLLIALQLCEGDGPRFDGRMDENTLAALVIQAHVQLRDYRDRIMTKAAHDQVIGTCFGDRPATKSVKVSEVQREVAQYATGPAAQCYRASYFGCTIADWIARAGLAQSGPAFGPSSESKIVIVEQTRNRVVADVFEQDDRLIDPDGRIDKDMAGVPPPAFTPKSRYTITRGADGHWRIFDRKPNFAWECRVR